MKTALVALALSLVLPILSNVNRADAGIEAEYQRLKRQNDALLESAALQDEYDLLVSLNQRLMEEAGVLPE